MEHPYPPDPLFRSSKSCKTCFPRQGTSVTGNTDGDPSNNDDEDSSVNGNEDPSVDDNGHPSDDDNAGPSGSGAPPGGGNPPDGGAGSDHWISLGRGGIQPRGNPPGGGPSPGLWSPPGRDAPSDRRTRPGRWAPPGRATRNDHNQGISSQHPVQHEQTSTKDNIQKQGSSDEDKKLRARMVELLFKVMEETKSKQRDSALKSKSGAEAPSENAKSESPVRNDPETKASHTKVPTGVDANPRGDSLYDSSIRDFSLQGNDAQHKETTSEPSSSSEPMFTLELKKRRNSDNAAALLLEDLSFEYGPQRFDGSNQPSHRPSREDGSIEELAFPESDKQNSEDRSSLPEDPNLARGPQRFDGSNESNHPGDSSECSSSEMLFLRRPSALRRVSADQKPLTTQMSNAEAYGMSSVRAFSSPTRPSGSSACNHFKRNPGVDSQCTPS